MTNRIAGLRDFIKNKKHHIYRQDLNLDFSEEYRKNGLTGVQRISENLVRLLNLEKAVILPDEKITILRTIKEIPFIFTNIEWEEIKKNHFIHELGYISNISYNYIALINTGISKEKEKILSYLNTVKNKNDEEKIILYRSVLTILDAISSFADKYKEEAFKQGTEDIYKIFSNIPGNGANNFHEALQFFRLIHFVLWFSGSYHVTIGRFDQYMYEYYLNDIKNGILTKDEAFELLEEYFISFNKDNDLYPGMQQGDNGQSIVLGGLIDEDHDGYNELSEMCLEASLELNLIDPKINLRVNKNTKPDIYVLGSKLTKKGLGFPQYSNDDVVIPGLINLGYNKQDAHNYVVAACWEFIIPEKGMDIPNIAAFSFNKALDDTISKSLLRSSTFEDFYNNYKDEMRKEIDDITQHIKNIYLIPGPFQSILMKDCIKEGKDLSKGCIYNNYGIHGTGIATAADSLAAIKKYVYQGKQINKHDLINALENDFEGYDEIYIKLKNAPKMGNNDDYVDRIAVELLNDFANVLKEYKNERGGIFRPGTGTAMYYLFHAKDLKASASGRKREEPLSANYSPALSTKVKGIVSVIKSFTKPDLKKVINGGPLTIELHDSIFRNEDSIKKLAMLVKSYIDMGGHQLQLNTINRDILLDAQKHPELYQNLIVRVWGWSGYYIELAREYQDHIIKRLEYNDID